MSFLGFLKLSGTNFAPTARFHIAIALKYSVDTMPG